MPTRNLDQIVKTLLEELGSEVNPERREFVKGYAPTAEDILGVSVPVIRKAAKKARAELKSDSVASRVRLAKKLLAFGYLETRQAAYELLAKDAANLTKTQLESVGKGIDNWATVDAFSTVLAGRAWSAGCLTDGDVRKWAHSKNPWWRRAALASTVALNVPARGGSGDSERTITICTLLAADHDVFVQKALSWSLRSLVRWDPAAVRLFLERHDEALPAFVIREVQKKLATGKKN